MEESTEPEKAPRKSKAIQRFQCDVCGRGYESKGALTHHRCRGPNWEEDLNADVDLDEDAQANYEKKKPDQKFQCDVCKREYLHKSSLRRHNCPGIEPSCKKSQPEKYVCDVCGREYMHKKSLLKHNCGAHVAPKVDSVPGNDAQCAFCLKEYCHRWSLGRHKCPEMQCTACSITFLTDAEAMSHWLTVHRRNFKCARCGKSFQRPGRLRVHERKHTGEKPHQCPECQKHFRRVSHLVMHLLVRHGINVKPFLKRRKETS